MHGTDYSSDHLRCDRVYFCARSDLEALTLVVG